MLALPLTTPGSIPFFDSFPQSDTSYETKEKGLIQKINDLPAPSRLAVKVAISIFAGCVMFTTATVICLFTAKFYPQALNQSNKNVGEYTNRLSFTQIAVTEPIWEEFTDRGLIMSGVQGIAGAIFPSYPGLQKGLTLVLPALFFGASHTAHPLHQVITFVGGLQLGLLLMVLERKPESRQVDGKVDMWDHLCAFPEKLLPSVVAHMTNNALTCI